jgi:transcription antitermination protein NusB
MAASKQGSRRSARQKAFQCLYGLDFKALTSADAVERTFGHFFDADESLSDKEREFALQIIRGVIEHRKQIDEVIAAFSQHWRLERIAKIELGILRIAVHEMIHRPDIPLKVSINEAIELSKAFGDENSRGFINGILDAVAKAVQDGRYGPGKEF